QVLRELNRIAESSTDQPSAHFSEPGQSTDAKDRQTTIAGDLWNSRNAVLRRDIRGVVSVCLQAIHVLPVESQAEFVDQSRAEGMRVAQRRSLRSNRLRAVGEAATISDPIERAGSKAVRIGETIPAEHLIARAEVVIDADIERVRAIGVIPI